MFNTKIIQGSDTPMQYISEAYIQYVPDEGTSYVEWEDRTGFDLVTAGTKPYFLFLTEEKAHEDMRQLSRSYHYPSVFLYVPENMIWYSLLSPDPFKVNMEESGVFMYAEDIIPLDYNDLDAQEFHIYTCVPSVFIRLNHEEAYERYHFELEYPKRIAHHLAVVAERYAEVFPTSPLIDRLLSIAQLFPNRQFEFNFMTEHCRSIFRYRDQRSFEMIDMLLKFLEDDQVSFDPSVHNEATFEGALVRVLEYPPEYFLNKRMERFNELFRGAFTISYQFFEHALVDPSQLN